MKRPAILTVTLFLAIPIIAQEVDEVAPASARDLLDQVIAQMPREPVTVTGRLQTKDRTRRSTLKLNVEALLRLGDDPATARYTIRDAFGGPREQLTVLRPTRGKQVYRYEKGNPLAAAATPNLHEAIQETNITWYDLSLSFLWWPTGKILDYTEEVKGRDCFVVEMYGPRRKDGRPAIARLWIDKKHRMLLRAEDVDHEGETRRRLSVKSFKKIDETWMIQDVEVLSLPSRIKTYLRISHMKRLEASPHPPVPAVPPADR